MAALTTVGLAAEEQPAADVTPECVLLEDGHRLPVVTLENDALRVGIVPELGGKIISLRSAAGHEYLSRSSRAYRARTDALAEFGETEFDGIDEIFPTLTACDYPAEPYADVRLPGHGALWRTAWERVASEGDRIVLRVRGETIPWTFTRSARLDGNSLVLEYEVTNTADEPFLFHYAFHPLFRGETGVRLDLPETTPVRISWSTKNWLGKRDTTRVLGEILDAEQKPFVERMFTEGSGRYWKFFAGPLPEGKTGLIYPGGRRLTIEWPVELLPYLAVWCSEGGVGDLHHIAPEPTSSYEEGLDKAHALGHAVTVPPRDAMRWTIKLTVEDAE